MEERPNVPGRCALWGFVLHGVAVLAGCSLAHPAMLPRAAHTVHRTMVLGPLPPANKRGVCPDGTGLRRSPDGATAPRA